MNSKELVRILKPLSRCRGYNSKGQLFWKSTIDTITLIEIQSSRWGSGVYINFGVMPARAVSGQVPPRSGSWGWTMRAESMAVSPFREQFWLLALGEHPERLSNEDVASAVKWLLDWIEMHLSDSDYVRDAVQSSESVLQLLTPASGAMKEWAASPRSS